jgi:LssY C-terminus
MVRQRTLVTLFLAIFGLLATRVWSQTSAESQDLTYTISTSQPWTDTGLDLQSGDLLHISASRAETSGCDPHGVSGAAQDNLPLPSAPVGALLAQLHAHGASPLLVADGTELRIAEPSHLFLGVNASGRPPCAGAFLVTVHRVAAGSQTRSQQLKSQLSAAAEIFMQGQFGEGKSAADANGSSGAVSGATGSGDAGSGETAPAVPVLKLSNAPLDSQLRKDIDGLPRRVNDQFQNLGDMVNFVIVGSQKSAQVALDAANWHVADTTKKKAVLDAVLETYEGKDYLQMPMSTLYLFGRPQDFGYEMAEPIAMVASRHHFRIWKTPFTWKGEEIWVGAGTHDVGFAKDKRNGSVTHKIDPLVDGERDNIGSSLQKADKVKSLSYYLPPHPVQGAKDATGDGYQSDGRLLVIILQ